MNNNYLFLQITKAIKLNPWGQLIYLFKNIIKNIIYLTFI